VNSGEFNLLHNLSPCEIFCVRLVLRLPGTLIGRGVIWHEDRFELQSVQSDSIAPAILFLLLLRRYRFQRLSELLILDE
jgi:hypothetical protein